MGVVRQGDDGNEHVRNEDGRSGKGLQIEVGPRHDPSGHRLAEGVEEGIVPAVPADRLVPADHPGEEADVRDVAFVTVQGLERVLAPFGSVIPTELRRHGYPDQAVYLLRSLLPGLRVEPGDVYQRSREHGRGVDGPLPLEVGADGGGHRAHQRLRLDHDLLQEIATPAEDVGPLRLERADMPCHDGDPDHFGDDCQQND